MGLKITDYANTRSSFDDGDLFDVSAFLNPGYESQKTTWALLKAGLTTAGFLSSGDVDLSYTASTRVIGNTAGDDATLPLFTSTEAGLVPLSGGGTTNFLRADGTWAAVGGADRNGIFDISNDNGIIPTDFTAQTQTHFRLKGKMSIGSIYPTNVNYALYVPDNTGIKIVDAAELNGNLRLIPKTTGGTNTVLSDYEQVRGAFAYTAYSGSFAHILMSGTAGGSGTDFYGVKVGNNILGSRPTAMMHILYAGGLSGVTQALRVDGITLLSGNTQIDGTLNLTPVTAPANPASGGVLYIDSADGDLKVKFSTGTTTTIATN